MKPYYADEAVTLHHGDALDVLRDMPDASVDAVVTDPPYGLEFMGRDWDAPWKHGFAETGYTDAQRLARPNYGSTRNPMCRTCRKHKRGTDRCMCAAPDFDETPADSSRLFGRWCETWAAECLRVLKPGGYLLAFGGTRTVHRLTCAIEDAGFEIRDGIDWLYGSGFPKSLNLGDGRGTALKPAREPIVMARKPLAGTVAANVQQYGTGALNIDATRVPMSDADRVTIERMGGFGRSGYERNPDTPAHFMQGTPIASAAHAHEQGRWPSNVVLSHAPDCAETCLPGCPVAELDAQSGVLTSGKMRPTHTTAGVNGRGTYGKDAAGGFVTMETYGDSGGASRFFPVFRYEAKAPTAERPRTADGTAHPTVKPLDLMRWLVRLVTPRGGTVLDLFAGSGTTGEACVIEGFPCVLIEQEPCGTCQDGCPDYMSLIVARLSKPLQPSLDVFGGGS